jgi:hypothetical protein
MRRLRGGVDALEEGGAEPRPILGSGDLVLARHSPNERRQSLQFWTRGASEPLLVLDDEREEQSWDELRECAEATMGSLQSTLEVLSRDVPRILQVRISGIPFTWSRHSLWHPASLPQDLMDLSIAKSSFIRREADVWGSLRFLRTALAEATERLSQRSAKAVDLRLLYDELGAEAAAARAEAQRRQVELGQVIGERDQSRGRAAEAESRAEALGGQLAEASTRAGALAADLAVVVESAQSAQATASEQRARAEGMSWLFWDFDSALFFNSCLKTSALAVCRVRVCPQRVRKALAQAAEQREADRVAMSEAISAFCQVFGLDDVPSGSSPKSRLQALGSHVHGRLREVLHHGVRWAFVVLTSHYDVDLERVSEGYCLPNKDEAALAEVQRLDAAAAGPSAVLASTFEVEILPPASPSKAGADLAEGGDSAEVGDEAEGAAPPPGDAWFYRSSLFWTRVCLSRPARPEHFVVVI